MTLKTLDSSVLSFIVLGIIFLDARSRLERKFTLYNLFTSLVLLNMILIVNDLVAWYFDGKLGLFNEICCRLSDVILFIIEPGSLVIWNLYANYLVFHDEHRLQKLKKFFFILLIINAVFIILNLYTGWFFGFNAQNEYYRGDFYILHLLFCIFILFAPFPFIFSNRQNISKKHFHSLLLFVFPLTVGVILQFLFYGVSYIWSGMMLSILIIYLSIQDRESSTDFLTEIYNRKQLDHFIKNKVRCKRKSSFSIILIDLDKFKDINDKYGHDVGDEALQDTVEILQRNLRHNDFLSRYGGDEFLIVMDIHTPELLEATIQRLKESFKEFNQTRKKPYSLSFSSGYYLYNKHSKMSAQELMKHVDQLMYRDKEKSKIL